MQHHHQLAFERPEQHAVPAVVGAHGAHQGVTVGALGEHRQVLADLQAGGARGDQLELAAHLRGRLGLEVEAVLV